MVVTKENTSDSWNSFVKDERPSNLRVRAIFLENLSGPVLQMLGAKFNIEPFFWSSSLNWIPSRYQEDPQAGTGDHITICLTFLRSMPSGTDAVRMDAGRSDKLLSLSSTNPSTLSESFHHLSKDIAMNTLKLNRPDDDRHPGTSAASTGCGQLLVLDLLSVHLIRSTEGSTIFSYHPSLPLPTTTAKDLQRRIRFAGQSVYWQKMFQRSPDPTFVLLTFLWHALYAWDEAFEHLYMHICTLETKAIKTNEKQLTNELHIIRAHQLHYSSLLANFTKTVEFIRDTRHPALESMDKKTQKQTRHLMNRECLMLLNEIKRLDMTREMQDKRLKNVMNLVFSTVNIEDSSRMKEMTEAAVRDSAAVG
ncbi:hypothetical protein D9756_008756 [Leucocoprinus leucothites]|uniref:Uncharacterized protein n=1 Tax=Leucocoprinus leucothites TaxID=201217 RepID=A0A8H5CZ79_9AGAR|nr:hypothetical protein D9756_008756 [Leucoagaricus leucothites]